MKAAALILITRYNDVVAHPSETILWAREEKP